MGKMAIDGLGALYGTADAGGANGYGAVFKLAPSTAGGAPSSLTSLFDFKAVENGRNPNSGIIRDSSGNLYGMTFDGGAHASAGSGGTVFELIHPAAGKTVWTEKVLHSFSPGIDGSNPIGGLLMSANGTLYGAASAGSPVDGGTIFSLKPPAAGNTAWTFAILHQFKGGADGLGPRGGLIADSTGALFGTTTNAAPGSRHRTRFDIQTDAARRRQDSLDQYHPVSVQGWRRRQPA